MTLEEFQQAVDSRTKPPGLSHPLMALWYAAQDNWDQAHDFAQRNNDAESAWVHAYLHRREGDLVNANYWYTRASRTAPEQPIEEEWQTIAQSLLSKVS